MFEARNQIWTLDNGEPAPEGHVWVFEPTKRAYLAAKVLNPPKTVIVKFTFENEWDARLIEEFKHFPGFVGAIEQIPQREPIVVLAERERCAGIVEQTGTMWEEEAKQERDPLAADILKRVGDVFLTTAVRIRITKPEPKDELQQAVVEEMARLEA